MEYTPQDKKKEEPGWVSNAIRGIKGLLWAEEEEAPEYGFDNPAPYKPPKFQPSDPAAAQYLQENGYVVFSAVADKSQQETAISLFWDLLEANSTKLKRDDPSTWENGNWIADTSVGIMSGYGIGQSAFVWYARTLPKVKEAFSNVWGTDDLLVSFDGCGVFRPIEVDPKWKTFGAWYHIDQNVRRKQGRHAIQGLLNLFPSGEFDGGLVVVPKSTHMVERAFEKYPDIVGPNQSRDFVKLYPDFDFWKEEVSAIVRDKHNKHDLLPVKLVLDAGDFVMWDSRCIHCNHPATKPSKDPEAATRLKRLTPYICMTPASSAADLETLSKHRVYAFQMGVTTTHWPHEFRPSWTYSTKTPGVGIDTVKLTPEQAKLITGEKYACDIYDKSLVEGLDIKVG